MALGGFKNFVHNKDLSKSIRDNLREPCGVKNKLYEE
jgi:hypothetical protein